MLDALVQLSVTDRDRTTPPETPAEGDRHIVATTASGSWSSKDNRIAAWQDGGWRFFAPREGWQAWVEAEQIMRVFNSGQWTELTEAGTDPSFVTLGVNGSADTTNRLAVKAEDALFDHDYRLKINKASSTDTGSIIFQTAYAGNAELGLTGDSDWRLKVSPDGSTWRDGMIVRNDPGGSNFRQIRPPRRAHWWKAGCW